MPLSATAGLGGSGKGIPVTISGGRTLYVRLFDVGVREELEGLCKAPVRKDLMERKKLLEDAEYEIAERAYMSLVGQGMFTFGGELFMKWFESMAGKMATINVLTGLPIDELFKMATSDKESLQALTLAVNEAMNESFPGASAAKPEPPAI